MAGGQRLISWLHPCSTSNVALNTRTCAHGPLMGHPNWAGCDNRLLAREASGIMCVVGLIMYQWSKLRMTPAWYWVRFLSTLYPLQYYLIQEHHIHS
jgi:hypothetical protein